MSSTGKTYFITSDCENKDTIVKRMAEHKYDHVVILDRVEFSHKDMSVSFFNPGLTFQKFKENAENLIKQTRRG